MNPEGMEGTATVNKRITLLNYKKKGRGVWFMDGKRYCGGREGKCSTVMLIIILKANQGRLSCAH
jgi:hypothetical protein